MVALCLSSLGLLLLLNIVCLGLFLSFFPIWDYLCHFCLFRAISVIFIFFFSGYLCYFLSVWGYFCQFYLFWAISATFCLFGAYLNTVCFFCSICAIFCTFFLLLFFFVTLCCGSILFIVYYLVCAIWTKTKDFLLSLCGSYLS